jgi:2-polyprenyl-6-methoxyphenol hydroxylase-like FAD-dependent oxidoreductase
LTTLVDVITYCAMKTRHVLVSGASIAGPALAFWLAKQGTRVTVVERAPALRDGGYAVDFRGASVDVLRRMGLLDRVLAAQTGMGAVSYVDATGRPIVDLPASFLSGEVEILRGDLGRILYDATAGTTEYVFGDSIASLQETSDGVDVTFERGGSRRFDLVIGADGVHSNVRMLAFGDESELVHHLGYYLAVFSTPNHLGLDHTGRYYNVPGKLAAIYSTRDAQAARAFFLFASPALDVDHHDVAQHKWIVTDAFAGVGWEVPRLLDALTDAGDLYFDSASQVRLPRWSTGRIALLGDAGYCASPLSGMGTGMAIVGAYVLAGELASAGDDHGAAFARYEQRMRPYVTKCHAFADKGGSWMAPSSRLGIWCRNVATRTLRFAPSILLNRIAAGPSNAVALPDYLT